jgi:hypothetical protein
MFATPPQREGQFTYPKCSNARKNDALVQTFVREAFCRDMEINENLNIMLGVSSLKNRRSQMRMHRFNDLALKPMKMSNNEDAVL